MPCSQRALKIYFHSGNIYRDHWNFYFLGKNWLRKLDFPFEHLFRISRKLFFFFMTEKIEIFHTLLVTQNYLCKFSQIIFAIWLSNLLVAQFFFSYVLGNESFEHFFFYPRNHLEISLNRDQIARRKFVCANCNFMFHDFINRNKINEFPSCSIIKTLQKKFCSRFCQVVKNITNNYIHIFFNLMICLYPQNYSALAAHWIDNESFWLLQVDNPPKF